MTAVTASLLDFDSALLQVYIVVDHNHGSDIDLVLAHEQGHRLAGPVHEGLRLGQEDWNAADLCFPDLGLATPAPEPDPCSLGQLVNYPKPDIVPVLLVLASRIAEPDDETKIHACEPFGMGLVPL